MEYKIRLALVGCLVVFLIYFFAWGTPVVVDPVRELGPLEQHSRARAARKEELWEGATK